MKEQIITIGYFIILRHDKVYDNHYTTVGVPLKKGYKSLEKAISIKDKKNRQSTKYVYTIEEIKF